MSSYRDDVQETVVAGSWVWGGARTVTEEIARASAVVVFGMGVLTADALAVADHVLDRHIHIVSESAAVADHAVDSVRALDFTQDVVRAVDVPITAMRVLHTDVLVAADEVIDSVRATVTEQAAISDGVEDARRASQLVVDTLRARDKAWQPARQLIEDHLSAAAAPFGGMRAAVLLADVLGAADEVLDARSTAASMLTAAARAADETWGVLTARGTATETAVIEDAMVGQGAGAGQVWTAPTGNWAMSRYAPASAEQLAVIDGVVYAVTADGVYALDGDAEAMAAEVRTGLLDMGQGQLALLDAAYVEYELAGTAHMTVGQSQTGQLLSWSYTLPPERAGTLTNGRFKFGRGLRGRHFSFNLRLDGTQGYINDWQTLFAKSQRRI